MVEQMLPVFQLQANKLLKNIKKKDGNFQTFKF